MKNVLYELITAITNEVPNNNIYEIAEKLLQDGEIFDTAIPIHWLRNIEQMYPNIWPGIVWFYDNDKNKHGVPVNIYQFVIERLQKFYKNDMAAAIVDLASLENDLTGYNELLNNEL